MAGSCAVCREAIVTDFWRVKMVAGAGVEFGDLKYAGSTERRRYRGGMGNIFFSKTYPRAFGTFPLKGAVLANALTTAVQVGYRAIDTAQMYENEAECRRGPGGSARPSLGVLHHDKGASGQLLGRQVSCLRRKEFAGSARRLCRRAFTPLAANRWRYRSLAPSSREGPDKRDSRGMSA